MPTPANRPRKPIIGANWKMNTTLASAIDLAEGVARRIGDLCTVDVVLCPPFPNLHTVYRVIEGGALQLGAQDLYWEASGPYTGAVSAPMLTAVGCTWVIAGHSERRHIFGESSEVVNRKVHAALHDGLNVILAIGETREERHAHRTEEILEGQLSASLVGVASRDMARIVVAYEPVWAIGTGETATADQVRDAHKCVRQVLDMLYGAEVAQATRIQYGGSVTSGNVAELLAEPGVDGALVGGASLKMDEFIAIVEAAANHAV